MSRLTFHRLLAEARPADPTGLELEQAAVRVLARVAVREGGAPPSPRVLCRRVAAALALASCLALALVGSARYQGGGSQEVEPEPLDPAELAVARCEGLVAAALKGDGGARRTLRQAGPEGRACVWSVAEAGHGEALRLLREGGTALSEAERERVAALALRPALTQRALDTLVEEPARAACVQLTRLLVAHAELESPVVAALQRVAARGGRAEAIEALLAGAAAGRVEAARAVVRLGPASSAERLLVLLPVPVLEGEALAGALAEARPTFAARVLVRAQAGDDAALAWAAAARLPACVPWLHARAVEGDLAVARRALAQLAHVGTTEAWLAIARSTPAAAGASAREHLEGLSATAARALAARVEASARDRAAGLLALASGGRAGLAELARLGEKPAHAPAVIDALTSAPCRGAAQHLLELARGHDTPLPIVAALGRRLALGYTDAGGPLLELGRQGATKAAVQALAASGEPGERFLALAAFDAALGEEARSWAERSAGERSAGDRGASSDRIPGSQRLRRSRPF